MPVRQCFSLCLGTFALGALIGTVSGTVWSEGFGDFSGPASAPPKPKVVHETPARTPPSPPPAASAAPTRQTFSWAELNASTGQEAVTFDGRAWFCHAWTPSGRTPCELGARPSQPGCYVPLNPARSAWVHVESAAAILRVGYVSPDKPRQLDQASGPGCGVPGPNDSWLLVGIR